jgi:competence protein ComEC
MLYWRPIVWDIESSRQVWTAGIFKDPYLPTLAAISGGQRIAGYVFEGLLISAVVQVFLLPLLVVYFHRVSPVSLLLNLWVGSVLALESFTALSAVLLSNVSSFLAAPVISVTELLNYLMIRAHAVLPQSEWGSWRVPNYSGWMRWIYVIYFVPLVPLSIALYKWDPFRIARLTASHTNENSRDTSSDNRPLYGFPCLRSVIVVNAGAVILLAVVIVFHPFSAPRPDGRLHIEQLDVGQGDSSLVTFPDGTTMLVDGGGRMRFQDSDGDDTADVFIPDSPGIGEAVVSPVLWEKGYSAIDHIVATHADADHVDGLADIVSNFRVGTAFFGRFPTADPELAGLIEALRSRGVPVEIVSRGDTLTIGDAFVEILYPLYDASPDAPSDNDHSVVVRIVYGNRAFLLTGDIERRGEMQLLSGGGDLSADVVKVAHHGSQTSSTPEFVSAVGARYAVISVGKRSIFGHPHRGVVERWHSAGARVMTTGEKGMISISTDGRDLEVRTFTEQK